MSLEPDRAEEWLVIVQDFAQEGPARDGLVLEEALEEHSDLKTRASLHEFADELAEVAADVIRLEHVDGEPDDVNGFDLSVSVKDSLGDLEADFFDAKVDRWVLQDVVSDGEGQLEVSAFHFTEVGCLVEEDKTVLELLSSAHGQTVLCDGHKTS